MAIILLQRASSSYAAVTAPLLRDTGVYRHDCSSEGHLCECCDDRFCIEDTTFGDKYRLECRDAQPLQHRIVPKTPLLSS